MYAGPNVGMGQADQVCVIEMMQRGMARKEGGEVD